MGAFIVRSAASAYLMLMAIYILKRYHKVFPSDGPVWHLGREVAFEAKADAEAIAFAKGQPRDDLPGGLVFVLNSHGEKVWESSI